MFDGGGHELAQAWHALPGVRGRCSRYVNSGSAIHGCAVKCEQWVDCSLRVNKGLCDSKMGRKVESGEVWFKVV